MAQPPGEPDSYIAPPGGEPDGFYPTPSLKPGAASSGPQSQKPQSKDEWAGEVAASKQAWRDAEDAYNKYKIAHPDVYETGGRVMRAGQAVSMPAPDGWTQAEWDAFKGSDAPEATLDEEGKAKSIEAVEIS